MQKCVMLHDDSLKFSRAFYGSLVLIAFLIHNQWLVLAVSLLMLFGVFSMKFNFPYQFHVAFLKKASSRKKTMVSKDSGEVNFVTGTTAALLFIGFLFIYFDKYVDWAWIYILIVTMLIFLACFVGFCVATLMYIFFKKIFKNR